MLHGQLASFNLGEIKNIVDDAQQILGRNLNLADVVSLLIGEAGLLNQVTQANNGIHWRANFMAHIGQEVALRLVGLIGQLFGLMQRLLALLAIGNVTPRRKQVTFALVLHVGCRHLHGEH